MKRGIRSVLLFSMTLHVFLFLVSCNLLFGELDKEVSGSGIIEGAATILPNGIVGVAGIAYPYAVVFPKREEVRYSIMQVLSKMLLEEKGVKEGDTLRFFFDFKEIGEGDWKTIISIQTDLYINGKPQ